MWGWVCVFLCVDVGDVAVEGTRKAVVRVMVVVKRVRMRKRRREVRGGLLIMASAS